MKERFKQMGKDLERFLKRHGIGDINDFLMKMDFKISCMEKTISPNEMTYAQFNSPKEQIIPISKLLGCSEGNLNFDTSFFKNFKNFFDSEQESTYYTRALKLLNISTENIMDVLRPSFEIEPIESISIGEDYFISNNGLHRFVVLKLYYILELYQGKAIQELDKKYQVSVLNKELDIFKTFTTYLGAAFYPSINFTDKMDKQMWLKNVKSRIEYIRLNQEDYQSFISRLSFMRFMNSDSGESMIKILNDFFPDILRDVIVFLCSYNHYEFIIPIVDCIAKYFPNETDEILGVINKYLVINIEEKQEPERYKFFDLQQSWNGYGDRQDILSLDRIQRNNRLARFAEGSEALEKCLRILWTRGLQTVACCKGNHISVTYSDKPEVECEAYIAFDSDSDWIKYLSKEIIENPDVQITESAIYYYGINHDAFFNMLSRDVILGKKDNERFIKEKLNKVLTPEAKRELEYKAFLSSLQVIGFDDEQIKYLCDLYLEIDHYMYDFYNSKNLSDMEANREKWHKVRQDFDLSLKFYISRNNEIIQGKGSLH